MTNPTHELEPRDKQAVEREGTRPGWMFRPDVDIAEGKEAYVITADLPGADESAVQIRFEDGVLVIDAALAEEVDAQWAPRRVEYRVGGWHREFRLSDEIDAEHIQARMRDGVLTLTLPRVAEAQPRVIEVRAG